MQKFNKICVLGLGYIGLPTASVFANCGLEVLGVDINTNIINTLNGGGIHLHEPGLHALTGQVMAAGRLRVGQQPKPADAFIIAVPTPFKNGKKADMRAVVSATEAILPVLKKGDLVVLESTSPPQTTTSIVAPILERSGLVAGEDFFLAYSPERVLPGKILQELVENDRVVGGINPQSAQAARDLYACIVKGEIFMTTSTTAEMVKLMENTYRDVNIAIANEFSRLADRFGVSVWEAIALANRHPRVTILNPGPGVGGHCISVDPWFLVEAAPDLTQLVRSARVVNDGQPQFVVETIKNLLGELQGKRITILGLTYKADVDDIRESPALEVVHIINDLGADVVAFDPYCINKEIPNVRMATSLRAAIEKAEMVVLLVPHDEFKDIKNFLDQGFPQEKPQVFDAVNLLDAMEWAEGGYSLKKLGVV